MTQARQHRPEPDLPLFAMETEALISWSGVGLPGSRLTPRVALLHHTLHEPSPDLLEANDRADRRNECLIQVNRAGTGTGRSTEGEASCAGERAGRTGGTW